MKSLSSASSSSEDEFIDSTSDEEEEDEEFAIDEEEQYAKNRDVNNNTITIDDDDDDVDEANQEENKSQNVAALVSGDLVVKRQSLLPRVLSVSEGAAVARKPFKPPFSGCSDISEQLLRKRLLARKRFVPWGSASPFVVKVPENNILNSTSNVEKNEPEEDVALPTGIEPLVLWQPEELLLEDEAAGLAPIMVDTLLVRFLRPHQREGVQFMFDCVSGLHSAAGISGCILADDMGLGKTLQSITLLYTLLRQGFDGKPMVKKAIIVTPTSLVSNWEAEIRKWIGERVQLIALCESSRDEVISGINTFINPNSRIQVLIVSYETFRMHSPKFNQSGTCDLVICDEAHRLKNDQTITNKALASLSCKRRILLSGTPMQNDLEEFYAMVNFTNPGILGDAARFRRYYEMPILCGREPTATEEQRTLGIERSEELSTKVNQFILRRTNALLSNHLPPKIVEVVCCKLTPLQSELYNHFLQSKNVKRVLNEEAKHSKILAYITALKKLCNHPKLIYDTIKGGNSGISGFENCMHFFPPEVFSGRSGVWTGGDGIWVELSGKMHVLARLLAQLRQKTDDRIVLVSNYTQTLDLFAQLCRERRYPYLRLDGSTSISKRQKLVNQFNDSSKDEFAFLLSSKAGGCGLNLVGGNRLVLFDPDWNPANDKQAAARVWRDGQKKRVYIYRFLSSGTIEEKVYQRQMSKEGLQKVIQQEQTTSDKGNFFSTEDLRDLFTYRTTARSDIHEKMNCSRCTQMAADASEADRSASEKEVSGAVIESDQSDQNCADIGGFAEISGCLHELKHSERQVGAPLEEDLLNWGHHFTPTTVPDLLFQAAAGDDVSFVFTNQIGGKLIPVESLSPKTPVVETKKLSNQDNSKENLNQRSMVSSVQRLLHSRNAKLSPSASSFKPVQPTAVKSVRSSLTDVTNLSWRPKLSLTKHLPLKRSCQSMQGDDAARPMM